MNNGNCPCGRLKQYVDCCQPIHNHLRKAETAEDLMRSRYVAFTLANGDYLLESHHSDTRNPKDKLVIQNWAKSVHWLKLEVLNTEDGQVNDAFGTVEFKAFFMENGKIDVIHENSTFKIENNRWVYYGIKMPN